MNDAPETGPLLDEQGVRNALAQWIADPDTPAEKIDAFVAAHGAHLRAHRERGRKPPSGPTSTWPS